MKNIYTKKLKEVKRALMALTLSNSEFESGSGSEYDEKDKEYPNLYWFYLIHNFMSLCQRLGKRVKVVKKQLEFLRRRIKII